MANSPMMTKCTNASLKKKSHHYLNREAINSSESKISTLWDVKSSVISFNGNCLPLLTTPIPKLSFLNIKILVKLLA